MDRIRVLEVKCPRGPARRSSLKPTSTELRGSHSSGYEKFYLLGKRPRSPLRGIEVSKEHVTSFDLEGGGMFLRNVG
jgi:hypothetical protein